MNTIHMWNAQARVNDGKRYDFYRSQVVLVHESQMRSMRRLYRWMIQQGMKPSSARIALLQGIETGQRSQERASR